MNFFDELKNYDLEVFNACNLELLTILKYLVKLKQDKSIFQ